MMKKLVFTSIFVMVFTNIVCANTNKSKLSKTNVVKSFAIKRDCSAIAEGVRKAMIAEGFGTAEAEVVSGVAYATCVSIR